MKGHKSDNKLHPEAVPLSEEDHRRMARLYEEVDSRIQEMTLIMARTLGRDSSTVVATSANLYLPPQDNVKPRAVAVAADSSSELQQGKLGLEIVSTDAGTGFYDYLNGI
jgi:hypothetical protein